MLAPIEQRRIAADGGYRVWRGALRPRSRSSRLGSGAAAVYPEQPTVPASPGTAQGALGLFFTPRVSPAVLGEVSPSSSTHIVEGQTRKVGFGGHVTDGEAPCRRFAQHLVRYPARVTISPSPVRWPAATPQCWPSEHLPSATLPNQSVNEDPFRGNECPHEWRPWCGGSPRIAHRTVTAAGADGPRSSVPRDRVEIEP